MTETMVLNFSRICRLCLSDDKTLLPLFNTAEKVQEKIYTISPTIEVYAGDGLPAQICKDCIHQVNISYKFIRQCKRSNAILRQHLNNQQPHDTPVQVVLKEEPSLCDDTESTNELLPSTGNRNQENALGSETDMTVDEDGDSDSSDVSFKDGSASPDEDAVEPENEVNTDTWDKTANQFCPLQSSLHGTTSLAIMSPCEEFCEVHCLKQGMCIQQFCLNHGDITSLSLKKEVMCC